MPLENERLLRMGWTICESATYTPGRTVHYHQLTKDRRRLSYSITTTRRDLRASLSPPKCEMQQDDGTWKEFTWREWVSGMPDKEYPFPFE